MGKVIIAEGKTTNEAIKNGLKQLNTTKENVTIKVLEEEKRMFFSILDPRVVKVEMTLKEEETEPKKPRKQIKLTKQEQETAKEKLTNFIEELIKKLEGETTYTIETSEEYVTVEMMNKNLGYLIGYRGETLYALQDVMSAIASKGSEHRVRVILDIEKYRGKRITKIVVRTRKEIKLEPMKPYERKIIHTKLQENSKVETKSIGEDPHRRIVISYKKR